MPSGSGDVWGPRFGVDVGRDGVDAGASELVRPLTTVGSLTPCAQAIDAPIAKLNAATAARNRMVNSWRHDARPATLSDKTFACGWRSFAPYVTQWHERPQFETEAAN
ncbi:hypothetical protein [Rhodopseudomonas telluris]|uniref:Uncharacterized protein n=1 Tax=Rhodopseudomonas telluris TaxID=644215 RepID=A0ABV6EVV4_9BRAD